MPDRNRASFRKVFARFQDTSLRGSTSAHRPRWRVALSLELVILTVAVFFAFTANGAFWASVKESDVLSGARELRFYIGVTAALVGLPAMESVPLQSQERGWCAGRFGQICYPTAAWGAKFGCSHG